MAKSIPLPLLSSEGAPSTETISLMTLRSPTYSATSFENGSATPSRSVTPIKGADRPKPAKKRASRACVACHARKVRCDATKRHPFAANRKVVCSNCALDGTECVMTECRRMRRLNVLANPCLDFDMSINNALECEDWEKKSAEINNLEAPIRAELSNMSNSVTEQYVSPPMYAHEHSNPCGDFQRHNTTGTPVEADRTQLLELTSRPIPSAIPFLRQILPGYLSPSPRCMVRVDIDYLFVNGALSIPDIPLRNSLLQSYFEYVHPYMPVIEVRELIEILEDGTGASGKISLLLFQAIMFAGTAFIDIELLRSAGFSNRKAARMAFFHKAKILYDFDYEPDRVSVIQSTLLMSYWQEGLDEEEDAWHWTSLSISSVYRTGLNRDSETVKIEPRRRKLWKRIWWSCFVQDHLIAVGMRRPTRIKNEHSDIPMLTENDMEVLQPLGPSTIIPKECTLRDTKAQWEFAKAFIAKVKVCFCISRLAFPNHSLPCQRPPQERESSTRSNINIFSERLDRTEATTGYNLELSHWTSELFSKHPTSNSEATILVQRALLNIAYFTTLSLLHQPQMCPGKLAKPDGTRELCRVLERKAREASKDIIRLSERPPFPSLGRYMPQTSATVMLLAIILLLLDIKSCKADTRRAALDNFYHYMYALQDECSSTDFDFDFALQFLQAAIRKGETGAMLETSTGEHASVVFYTDKTGERRMRWAPHPNGEHDNEDALRSAFPGSTPASPIEAIVADSDVDLRDFVTFD